MTKIDIRITRNKDLTKLCLFCEREVGSEYHDIAIRYDDGQVSSGRFRHLCNDCHCALKKIFTGVD